MENDRSALDSIVSDLNNPELIIRDAALQATIQFASRDAIPALTRAAEETSDAAYKQALNDAIEFLKLPSLTEVLAEKRAASR